MKKFLLISLFLPVVCWGQDQDDLPGNFRKVDGETVWRKVYNRSVCRDDVFNIYGMEYQFVCDNYISATYTVNDLKATLSTSWDRKADDDLYGGLIVSNKSMRASVIIEIKEDRYRVTLNKIVLGDVGEFDSSFWAYGSMFTAGTVTNKEKVKVLAKAISNKKEYVKFLKQIELYFDKIFGDLSCEW